MELVLTPKKAPERTMAQLALVFKKLWFSLVV